MNFFGVISLIVFLVRTLSGQESTTSSELLSVSPFRSAVFDERDAEKGLLNNINNIFKPIKEETHILSTKAPFLKPKPVKPVLSAPTVPPDMINDLDDGVYHGRPNKEDKRPKPVKEPPNLLDTGSSAGREPQTIQEWMNENRPISAGRKPTVTIPLEDNPLSDSLKPVEFPPWADPKPNTNSGPKSDPSRPSPIKPSYQPAPWEINPGPAQKVTSQKPNNQVNNQGGSVGSDWWEDKPIIQKTTPFLKPKSTKKPKPDVPYDEWEGETTKPQKPRAKPHYDNSNIYPPPIDDSNWRPEPINNYPNNNYPNNNYPNNNYQNNNHQNNNNQNNNNQNNNNQNNNNQNNNYPKPGPQKPEKPSHSGSDYWVPPPPNSLPEIPQGWTGNPNLPTWWNEKPPGLPGPQFGPLEPEPEAEVNGWGGNIFGDNSGNGIGGMGDINGIGGAIIGTGSGNGEGGVGHVNGIGGNVIADNGANGVGGVGNENGQGGFIIGNNSGNGKGGVGNNNGIGGNKGGRNSGNGTGGVGNNNGKGGIIIGSNSGNGVGGVNQEHHNPQLPSHKP